MAARMSALPMRERRVVVLGGSVAMGERVRMKSREAVVFMGVLAVGDVGAGRAERMALLVRKA
jgi:hypothetical protein